MGKTTLALQIAAAATQGSMPDSHPASADCGFRVAAHPSILWQGLDTKSRRRREHREKVTMAQQSDVMARARALQGLVRAEAPRTESQGTLTAPVVQALLDAGLFYLMVPAALGGLEVDGRVVISK
jgi:hypothetical protein